jgi:hypothetical protein
MRLVSVLVLVLAVVLAGLTPPARAHPRPVQEATPAGTPMPFVGETYVGQTSDPDTFVAIVVAEGEGAEAERQARAYLCNGTTIDVWLMGTLTGEQLSLQAEDGAQLEATLSETGVTGSATLADETALTFDAVPATGIAGLYTLTSVDNGQVRGVSAAGGYLEGRVEAEVATPEATPTPGSRLVMTVTSPQGETADLEAAVVSGTGVEAGDRVIVLEDGEVRGKRVKQTRCPPDCAR